MAMQHTTGLGPKHVYLEAEVQENGQSDFEERYENATGVAVSPTNPSCYQDQPNKWGTELRVYFRIIFGRLEDGNLLTFAPHVRNDTE